MTTNIEQREDVRNVRVDHLLGVYAVGSGDWPWTVEYQELIDRPETRELIASVQAEGIHEPILLGTDGRVWDGHHRVVVAMHLGLDAVPVEWAGADRPEPPMATNIERIIDASEPAVWERYSALLADRYRRGEAERVRAAFEAGFNAGIEFIKTVTDNEERS